ncbi:hypothetical protein Cgig2_000057 [Carnegiea gigantea]|uniref:Retrovirus-related Pol polyprotein from transposon TNT 1-94-like beta-barrel domain-containing protein n=1 Tax=Carnegiea gigantea TaxID=171969 RepID=A0A9Q1KZM4_9CARY|nr:hypothetical protein Cgig2_000057 [Carnegiea gigantea]
MSILKEETTNSYGMLGAILEERWSQRKVTISTERYEQHRMSLSYGEMPHSKSLHSLEDEDNLDANVIDRGDVFLAKSAKESVDDSIEDRNSWELDSAASMHIGKDDSSFDTLHSYRGKIHLKLHNGEVRTFHNVKHVPSPNLKLFSLGELTSHGYKYVGVRKWCKVYKGN